MVYTEVVATVKDHGEILKIIGEVDVTLTF
jgi:hypothetical protein